MSARVMTVDFTRVPDHRQHKSGKLRDRIPAHERPRTADGKLLTPKQVRARLRRQSKRADLFLDKQEIDVLARKPLEDWDLTELARGRPRAKDGTFKGRSPNWITRAVHEQSMERFKAAIKTEMNATTVDAMSAITLILNNNDVDDKGKPLVPASTKLDAAKFLLEHVVGKPKQQLEADVSVQLQSILSVVVGNPTETLMAQAMGGQGYTIGHLPGVTMPFGVDEEIQDAEFEEGGDDDIIDDIRA